MALPVTSNTKELKLFSVHQTPSTTANKGTLAINQRQAIAIRLQKEKKKDGAKAQQPVGSALQGQHKLAGFQGLSTLQLCLSKLNMETGLCLLVPSALTAESCLGTSSKESKVFFSSF